MGDDSDDSDDKGDGMAAASVVIWMTLVIVGIIVVGFVAGVIFGWLPIPFLVG